MTVYLAIESVTGREDAVLSLLNEAYDDWGDEAHFRWKYDEYPDYDPEEHTFAALVDDEIAAFRRVFRKDLIDKSESVTTFVLGDTAVAPDYQGQGLYSNLLEETTNYCRDFGAEAEITYNNVDNITFNTKQKRGWEFSVLPLRLFIHSYETVLSHYADLAIPEESVITSIAGEFGDRLALQVGTEHISVAEVFNSEIKDGWRLELSASPRAVVRLVETASNDSIVRVVPTCVGLLASGDVSLVGSPEPPSTTDRSAYSDVEVVDPESLSSDDIDAMVDLCKITTAGRLSFRRERRDVEHILAYPDAKVLTVRDGEILVGFAVVGSYENNDVVEARVLDMAAPSDTVANHLYRELEQYTAVEGYDLLVIISEQDPGPEWASIERQTIMWNRTENQSSGDVNLRFPPAVSMYDVL
ncbi:GNAT family N-acetyltransferase [Natrialbaceae archaeon A-CW1-1]